MKKYAEDRHENQKVDNLTIIEFSNQAKCKNTINLWAFIYNLLETAQVNQEVLVTDTLEELDTILHKIARCYCLVKNSTVVNKMNNF